MEITGHRTLSVFNRYNITDDQDRRQALLALAQPVVEELPKERRGKVVKMARRAG